MYWSSDWSSCTFPMQLSSRQDLHETWWTSVMVNGACSQYIFYMEKKLLTSYSRKSATESLLLSASKCRILGEIVKEKCWLPWYQEASLENCIFMRNNMYLYINFTLFYHIVCLDQLGTGLESMLLSNNVHTFWTRFSDLIKQFCW